ncbi:hypothetical protein EMPS_04025 [Entomortierella parvispora]|uniref:Integrase catalytic domain-containing protein n=1 Tax=Entomortierella parvispora TaxID=205924 RepID=A0A9P3H7Y8_9FUNG|nr:hypothetical protein EMPS_04025 [Entomortierella parvispora]
MSEDITTADTSEVYATQVETETTPQPTTTTTFPSSASPTATVTPEGNTTSWQSQDPPHSGATQQFWWRTWALWGQIPPEIRTGIAAAAAYFFNMASHIIVGFLVLMVIAFLGVTIFHTLRSFHLYLNELYHEDESKKTKQAKPGLRIKQLEEPSKAARGQEHKQAPPASNVVKIKKFRPDVLPKFAGRISEDPEAFLRTIDSIKRYYNLTDEELLRAIPTALDGPAAAWMSRIDAPVGTVSSYNEEENEGNSFVVLFRGRFNGDDYKASLHQQLQQVHQKDDESVVEYGERVYDLVQRIDPHQIYPAQQYIQTLIDGLQDNELKTVMNLSMAKTLQEALSQTNFQQNKIMARRMKKGEPLAPFPSNFRNQNTPQVPRAPPRTPSNTPATGANTTPVAPRTECDNCGLTNHVSHRCNYACRFCPPGSGSSHKYADCPIRIEKWKASRSKDLPWENPLSGRAGAGASSSNATAGSSSRIGSIKVMDDAIPDIGIPNFLFGEETPAVECDEELMKIQAVGTRKKNKGKQVQFEQPEEQEQIDQGSSSNDRRTQEDQDLSVQPDPLPEQVTSPSTSQEPQGAEAGPALEHIHPRKDRSQMSAREVEIYDNKLKALDKAKAAKKRRKEDARQEKAFLKAGPDVHLPIYDHYLQGNPEGGDPLDSMMKMAIPTPLPYLLQKDLSFRKKILEMVGMPKSASLVHQQDIQDDSDDSSDDSDDSDDEDDEDPSPAAPKAITKPKRVMPLDVPEDLRLVFFPVIVGNEVVDIQLDNGARVSTISEKMAKALGLTLDPRYKRTLKYPNGIQERTIGSTLIELGVTPDITIPFNFSVIAGQEMPFLAGLDFIKGTLSHYDPELNQVTFGLRGLENVKIPIMETGKEGKGPPHVNPIGAIHLAVGSSEALKITPNKDKKSFKVPSQLLQSISGVRLEHSDKEEPTHVFMPNPEVVEGEIEVLTTHDLPTQDFKIKGKTSTTGTRSIGSLEPVAVPFEPTKPTSRYDINPDLPEDQKKRLESLLQEYDDCFIDRLDQIRVMKIEPIEIQLMPGARPVKQPPRKLSPEASAWLKEYLNRLMENGLIRRSKSPWASPIVLVQNRKLPVPETKGPDVEIHLPAPIEEETDDSPFVSSLPFGPSPSAESIFDEGLFRLCIDYKELNKRVIKDAYPMPSIQTILSRFRKKRFFSAFDFYKGFWAAKLANPSLSAFVCEYGLFESLRLPFGYTNSPAWYQRVMDHIFEPLIPEIVQIYMDDSICASEEFEDHLVHLRKILDLIRKYRLSINRKKTHFGYQTIALLGHQVGVGGIQTNPKIIEKIKQWPTPRNRTQAKGFFALSQYFRRFIKDFGKISRPITLTFSTKKAFEWTKRAQKAKRKLQRLLTHAPILIHPDPDKDYILDVDASEEALGAILQQLHDGYLHPVLFWSYALKGPEVRYSTYERELLALVKAIEYCRPYLLQKHFTVRTDHQALRGFTELANPTPKIFRWMMRLSEFSFEIHYMKGKENVVAHELSHYPGHQEETQSAPIDMIRLQPNTGLEDLLPFTINKYTTIWKCLQPGASGAIQSNKVTTDQVMSWHRKYVALGGDLYKRADSESDHPRRFLRPSEVPGILKEYHDSELGGHTGIASTFNKIREKYYWPGYYGTVAYWVKSCPVCQKHGNEPPKRKAQELVLLNDLTARLFLDHMHMGPSEEGHKWILVGVNETTGWVEAQAVKQPSVDEVALFIFNWICRFSCPITIHCDQGQEFKNQTIDVLLTHYNIKLEFSTAHVSRGSGIVERRNQTIRNVMNRLASKSPRDWPHFLNATLYVLRTLPNRLSGFSPMYLETGRQPRMPGDLRLLEEYWDQSGLKDEEIEEQALERAVYLYNTFEKVRQNAYSVVNAHRRTMIATSMNRKKTRQYPFQEDDLVDLFNKGKKATLHSSAQEMYSGPFKIVKVLDHGKFILSKDDQLCPGHFDGGHLRYHGLKTKSGLNRSRI